MSEIPKSMSVPVEYLRERLRYCRETGQLYWRPRPRSDFNSNRIFNNWNTRFANKLAFKTVSEGYLGGEIAYKGVRVVMCAHRVIWAMETGSFPPDVIDHIDRDTHNNRIENLRAVTHTQNMWNTGPRKNGRQLRGARPCGKKWNASISVNSKLRHLGTFDTEIEAHQAYRAAVEKFRPGFSA